MLEDWPDPRAAKDTAAFVAALRELRGRSGMSFRALARKAEQAGDVLPVSTINAALSRDRLPRPDLVAAYVRACGGDEPTVQTWLAARADLAASSERGDEPQEPPESPSRRRWLLVVAASAIVVVVAAVVLVVTREPTSPAAEPTQQPPTETTTAAMSGPQRITVAETGLCVGEGPERSPGSQRTVLGQYDCAEAAPPIGLRPVPGGAYQLVLQNPDLGPGCATVDYGGTAAEMLIAGADCEPGRPDQEFTLERVTTPVAGFRLRSVAGKRWCIGLFQGRTEPGTQLIQDRCDGGKHQVFVLPGR